MARKIDRIYSGEKLVKLVISGEEAVKKPAKLEEKAELEAKGELEKNEVIEIFMKIPTVTKKKAVALYNAGIKSLQELALASAERLLSIKEITIKNVKAIKSELKGIYEEVKPKPEKIELGTKLKAVGGKILTTGKTVGKKILSTGKKGLGYAKKGATTVKAKLKSTYKKLAAPEEVPKPEKVVKKIAKVKRKAKRKRPSRKR